MTDRLTDGQTPHTSVTIVCISCVRSSLKISKNVPHSSVSFAIFSLKDWIKTRIFDG